VAKKFRKCPNSVGFFLGGMGGYVGWWVSVGAIFR
jgi:hypothetical protein